MVCHRSMLWVTTVVGRGTKSRNKCHPSPCSGQKSMQTQNHRSWVQNFPFVCQSAVTDWVLRNRSQEGRSISVSTSFGRWLLGTSKSLPVMEQSIMMEEMWVPQASQEEGKRERSVGREAVPSKGHPQWTPPTARPYSQQVIRLQAPEEAGFLRVTSRGMQDHTFSAWVFMELEWDFLCKPQWLP